MGRSYWWMCLLSLTLILGACSGDEDGIDEDPFGAAIDEDGKFVLEGSGHEDSLDKSDAVQGRPGLATSVDSSASAVWEVRNQWADTDTPAARQAGLAWGENSGLDWDEKFRAWVQSLERTERHGSFGDTFILTTPWGVELPAPVLECAEVAMFLRVAFASWYHLPYFIEAIDGNRQRVFFGHFGIRTESGVYTNMPNFKNLYADHSDRAERFMSGEIDWPTDARLANRKLAGGRDDQQRFLGDGAHAGAYFDRIFLNKRVGYFLLLHLAWTGSTNLADAANLFNLHPAGLQAGDVLVHRWQRNGIGHVYQNIRTERIGTQEIDGQTMPVLETELASGSMPRRQPVWETPASSKRHFMNNNGGGPDRADLGGGLKRWRSPRVINGRWTNMVPAKDFDYFISSRDHDNIAARPALFDDILKSLSPQERLNAIVDTIEAQRNHLRQYPASCAARNRREDAFAELYQQAGQLLDMTKEEVDAEYRNFEDYVFAQLEYEQSKTCCWNSTTANMYDIIMSLNRQVVEDDITQTCNDIVVFKNRDDAADGFQVFREHAQFLGRAAEWVTWSADERCPQSGVAADTEADHQWTHLCELPVDVLEAF